jgi:HEAT repeat protein
VNAEESAANIERLTAIFKNNPRMWKLRMEAIARLGSTGDTRVVDVLISALDDSQLEVRLEAVRALGKVNSPRVSEVLIAAVTDDNHLVRQEAVTALEAFPNERSVDVLISALKDGDRDVRFKAAQALGKIADPLAVGALCSLLTDTDEFVQRKAAESLGKIADSRCLEPLISSLKEGGLPLRVAAAKALGAFRDRRCAEALIAALKDTAYLVRSAAVGVLKQVCDATAVPLLIECLETVELACAIYMVEILGDLNAVNAAGPILKLRFVTGLEDRALEVLRRLEDGCDIESLSAAVRDKNCFAKEWAANLLLKKDPVRAVSPLLAALQHDKEIASTAYHGLKQILTDSAPSLSSADLTRLSQANDSVGRKRHVEYGRYREDGPRIGQYEGETFTTEYWSDEPLNCFGLRMSAHAELMRRAHAEQERRKKMPWWSKVKTWREKGDG